MKVMNHLIYAIDSTIPDEGDEPSAICYRQYNNR